MPIDKTLGRRTRIAQPIADVTRARNPSPNPLGEAPMTGSAVHGFNPDELRAEKSDAIPAWQRDTGDNVEAFQEASLERKVVLKSISQVNRCGVIFDKSGRILHGTAGWRAQLASVSTLSASVKTLTPRSLQSQTELSAALNLLFGDHKLTSVPVALRDLDGWVSDLIHIQRVGRANPDCAFTILPKSLADFAASAAGLSHAMGLTKQELSLVALIVRGLSEREMAEELSVKVGEIRRGVAQLTRKFGVRQKNDIARLLASFP